MNIVLTGASGLVGKELGKALARAGHHLFVLARAGSLRPERYPFPCELHEWDASDTQPPPNSLWENKIDAVIHLAGESIAGRRWNKDWKQRLINSRVNGGEALSKAIARLPEEKRPRVVISASAIGIYGDQGDAKLTEESEQGDDFLSELCRKWESAFSALPKSTRHVAIRIGLVLSSEGGFLEKLLPIFRAGLGGKLGNGNQWMSWIHIHDLCGLIKKALEDNSWQGAYNGVSPNPVRNDDFTHIFANALNRSAPFPVPYPALRIAAGEFAAYIMASQRVLPARAESQGFHFNYPDLKIAMEAIFQPSEGDLTFTAEQWIPNRREDIFPFFADERNLERITPPSLGFKVLEKSSAEIQEGTEIRYKLKLHGFPIRWRTKIMEWSPNTAFVDNQESGPYKKWHHRHEFEELANGTLMRDHVRYRLPLGRLGEIVAGNFVRKDVENIFRFRRKVIGELFGRKAK